MMLLDASASVVQLRRTNCFTCKRAPGEIKMWARFPPAGMLASPWIGL